MSPKRKFIIDTDPGIDDVRAILFLLSVPEINVLALTTVGGNTYTVQASYNAGIALNSIKRNDIPIYQGTLLNTMNEIVESDDYFGPDGLCTLNLPPSPVQVCSDKLAPQAIVDLCCAYPNEITLVCLGPLTNLAMAYNIDHGLPAKLKNLYIMGGDRAEMTENNCKDYAEFNFYSDPLAAQIVLNNFGLEPAVPLVLVDWTLCLKYPILGSFFDNIANSLSVKKKNCIMGKLFSARPPSYANDKTTPNEQKALYIADDFIAMISYDQNIMTRQIRCRLASISTSEKRGHTLFEPSSTGNIILADEINIEKFKSYYIK
ncbi:hypothetical protein HZS_2169, partial [Henneguya salminicola]